MKKALLKVSVICLAICSMLFLFTACGDSPISFKLNFIVDNEIVTTIDTTGKEKIALPNDPQKDGYTFDGWFWDKDVWEKPFTANSLLDAPLSSDMSVYAKFTKNHEHNYTASVTEPNCTEKGYTTYTCDCGESYIGNYVNELGHDYNAVVTEPTCTEQGYTTYTCSRCNDSYNNTYTDALGHNFGEWVETTAPTCTEKGEKQRICSRDATHKETIEIAATGHKFSIKWTYDSGYHYHESLCGHNIISDRSTHDFETDIISPTCDTNGYTLHTCKICGYSYADNVVSATGHAYSGEWTKDENYHWHVATCEHTGEIKDKELHKWDGGVETIEATETIQGELLYTCTVCGQTKTVKTGYAEHVHNYSDQWSKDEYYHWHNCVGCEQLSEKEEHVWDVYRIIDEATYDSDGEIEFTCSVCGKTKIEILYRLKHTVIFMGYDNTTLSTIYVNEGTSFDEIEGKPYPVREHYVFAGWDSDTEWEDNNEKIILSDMTFTAMYKIEQVDVTFKLPDGTVVKEVAVDYEGTVEAPIPSEYIYDSDSNSIITPALPLYWLIGDKICGFTGWDTSLNNIVESTTITAEYANVCEIPILSMMYSNKMLSISIQNQSNYQLYAFEFEIDYTFGTGNIVFNEENGVKENMAVGWLNDGNDKLYTININDKTKRCNFIWSAKGNGLNSGNLDKFIDLGIELNNDQLNIVSRNFKVISISAIVSYDSGETFEKITPSVIYR